MVDPNKPYNTLLPLPPENKDFETVEILKLCIDASRALSRLDGQTSTAYRNFANAFNMIKLFSVPEAVAMPIGQTINIIKSITLTNNFIVLPEE